MIKDNESFNQLVQYIDEDLLNVLTDEQRDRIYALAASSIALKERHDTLDQRQIQKLAGITRENMDYGPPAKQEYGPKYWCCNHILVIIIGVVSIVSALYSFIV